MHGLSERVFETLSDSVSGEISVTSGVPKTRFGGIFRGCSRREYFRVRELQGCVVARRSEYRLRALGGIKVPGFWGRRVKGI